ncbi:C4-dicarboxylate ABC transporter permease [Clostridiales bacterium PH28_bin88]|nr:C4-dicarboxylate ABC transporter permease [Clostridiales bacterium PH28_bin88]
MVAAVLFSTLFGALLVTAPIAISLILACALVFFVFYPNSPMVNLLTQSMVTTIDSFPLMAVPFFMLVGILMEKTGLAKRLINVGEAIAGTSPGGLGAATIIACMFFAAISGSGPAVVAAIGAIMIPAMGQRGYDKDYAGALVAAAATTGPVIPPSIPMIIYGATVGVSVIKLFTGGFLPGILMGGGLLAVNYYISKKRGYVGVPRQGGFKWVFAQIWEAKWALIMPGIVLGGIYAGFFTPTEAAIVGCIYAIFVGKFVYKDLTLPKFKDSLVEAALLSAIVMILLGGATTFGRLLTLERIPEQLSAWMLSITQTPIIIMLMINFALLISGMFIDTISNVVLFSPLFVPIVMKAGYDPVYFGVIMTVNLCIGFLTPPLGMNLFVAQGVAKVPFENIVKEVLPHLAVLIIALALMLFFPQIVTWLPEVLGL